MSLGPPPPPPAWLLLKERRERIAIALLPAVLGAPYSEERRWVFAELGADLPQHFAKIAFALADAVIAESDKGGGQEVLRTPTPGAVQRDGRA